jgi:hypothetical protein
MDAPARPVSSRLRGNQKGRFELEFKAPLLDGRAPRLFHGVWWRAALTMRLFPVPCVLTQHAEKFHFRGPIRGPSLRRAVNAILPRPWATSLADTTSVPG